MSVRLGTTLLRFCKFYDIQFHNAPNNLKLCSRSTSTAIQVKLLMRHCAVNEVLAICRSILSLGIFI